MLDLLCTTCNQQKPENEFHANNKAPNRNYKGYKCKPCEHVRRKELRKDPEWVKKQTERATTWRQDNLERSNRNIKNSHLKKRYGINLDEFETMIKLQDFQCAICAAQIKEPAGNTANVDHCHTTGAVRGILCKPCNTMLGCAKDSTHILRQAVEYLNDHI